MYFRFYLDYGLRDSEEEIGKTYIRKEKSWEKDTDSYAAIWEGEKSIRALIVWNPNITHKYCIDFAESVTYNKKNDCIKDNDISNTFSS